MILLIPTINAKHAIPAKACETHLLELRISNNREIITGLETEILQALPSTATDAVLSAEPVE